MVRNWAGKSILNGGELGVKLRGLIGFGNRGVMLREIIPLETKRADPNFGVEIDAAKRVEHGGAGLTLERRILESEDVGMRSDRRDRGGEWDHALAQFDFGAWPGVPRHPYSVYTLWIHLSHLRRHNSD